MNPDEKNPTAKTMKPTMKSLSIEEAAKVGKKDGFFQNVKKEIIPKLIKSGRLNGKTGKGKSSVVDDMAFQQVMQFGIESFVYNQQGWSFTAVKAPVAKVAEYLKNRKGVLNQVENVKVAKLKKNADVGFQPEDDKRHIFVIKTRVSDWTVILQTIHWIKQTDMLIGLMLAAELSKVFKTTAVAAWDDDFSGSTAVLCENGKKVGVLADEEDWANLYLHFYEQGILVPESFISISAGKADLLVADPEIIERADYLVISIPTEAQTNSPHVFFKIGMLVAAAASGEEDESSFSSSVVDRLWKQVEASLKTIKL